MTKVSSSQEILNNIEQGDYENVGRAIEYIENHVAQQPSLEQLSNYLNASPTQIQKVFSRWAGLSPKQFLQALSVEHAKYLLRDPEQLSLLDVSEELGFSSASRLYDHFVTLEAMTPGEYRKYGKGLDITYGCVPTPYGEAVIAFTERGICEMSYCDAETKTTIVERLASQWNQASLVEDNTSAMSQVDKIFSGRRDSNRNLKLLVKGTNFQIAVWRALLKIPEGSLVSYGDLASAIGKPKAVRAVGSAVGSNPISLIIPCHRVIRASGALGGYRGGLTRKKSILLQELS